jgi:hypothetical protein
MGLPSRFWEKKFVKDEKDDDITPFDGMVPVLFPFSKIFSFPKWQRHTNNVDSLPSIIYWYLIFHSSTISTVTWIHHLVYTGSFGQNMVTRI